MGLRELMAPLFSGAFNVGLFIIFMGQIFS